MSIDPLGVVPNGENPNLFYAPLQYFDSLSLYEYGKSSPILYIDPFGLCKCVSYNRSIKYNLPGIRVPSPYPFLTIKGYGSINGSIELNTCEKCCPKGVLGTEDKLKVIINGTIGLEVLAGKEIDIKLTFISIKGYAGIKGNVCGSFGVSAGGTFVHCPPDKAVSFDICGEAKLAGSLTGGGMVEIRYGKTSVWTAGAEAFGNLTTGCKACLTCSSGGCSFKGLECQKPVTHVGVKICFGPCATYTLW